MAAKKTQAKPPVVEIDEIVDEVETVVVDDSPITGVFPSEPVEARIMQLLRRRGGVGSLHQTVSTRFPDEPMPSTEDEWIAFMNRLER